MSRSAELDSTARDVSLAPDPNMIAAVGLSDVNYEVKCFGTKVKLSTDWLTACSSVFYERVTFFN